MKSYNYKILWLKLKKNNCRLDGFLLVFVLFMSPSSSNKLHYLFLNKTPFAPKEPNVTKIIKFKASYIAKTVEKKQHHYEIKDK